MLEVNIDHWVFYDAVTVKLNAWLTGAVGGNWESGVAGWIHNRVLFFPLDLENMSALLWQWMPQVYNTLIQPCCMS